MRIYKYIPSLLILFATMNSNLSSQTRDIFKLSQPTALPVDSLKSSSAILRFYIPVFPRDTIYNLLDFIVFSRREIEIYYQVATDTLFTRTSIVASTAQDTALKFVGPNALRLSQSRLPTYVSNLDSSFIVQFPLLNLRPNTQYYYRGATKTSIGLDFPVTSVPSSTASFTTNTLVATRELSTHLQRINLTPNPFRESITLDFSLDAPSDVALQIISSSGDVLATIPQGSLPSGNHSFQWNGKTRDGTETAQGIYFIRLMVNGKTVDSAKIVKTK